MKFKIVVLFQVEIKEYERSQKFIVTLKSVNHENLATLMNAVKAGNEKTPQTIIQVCVQWKVCGFIH